MRCLSSLALLCLALAACSREAAPPPDLKARRLADEVAADRPVQREQVGSVVLLDAGRQRQLKALGYLE